MSRRSALILSGGILTGLFIGVVFMSAIASQTRQAAPPPPKLGGQQVPAKRYQIQFEQKYDLYCSFYGGDQTTYRNCRILGFIGPVEDSAKARQDAGSSGLGLSSVISSPSYYTEYFDRWLVLELEDGRLAYIPPTAIKYIEQSSSKRQ
jgi:hypothetical protein